MNKKTKTIVGFVADFPSKVSRQEPAGKELSFFIHESLIKEGYKIEKPSEREGWAWDFYFKIDDLLIETIIGLVDDFESNPPRQWLITNSFHSHFSLIEKLFKKEKVKIRKAEIEEKIVKPFCTSIHKIISNDERFKNIMWYNADTFDGPNDQPDTKP